MTKYRVHLQHDKSVVVEADDYYIETSGALQFTDKCMNSIPFAFSPTRWVWVEEEKE